MTNIYDDYANNYADWDDESYGYVETEFGTIFVTTNWSSLGES